MPSCLVCTSKLPPTAYHGNIQVWWVLTEIHRWILRWDDESWAWTQPIGYLWTSLWLKVNGVWPYSLPYQEGQRSHWLLKLRPFIHVHLFQDDESLLPCPTIGYIWPSLCCIGYWWKGFKFPYQEGQRLQRLWVSWPFTSEYRVRKIYHRDSSLNLGLTRVRPFLVIILVSLIMKSFPLMGDFITMSNIHIINCFCRFRQRFIVGLDLACFHRNQNWWISGFKPYQWIDLKENLQYGKLPFTSENGLSRFFPGSAQ